MKIPSSLSGATYSPEEVLKIFLALSMISIDPLGLIWATSPLLSQPSSVKASEVFTGSLKYPLVMPVPFKQSSPVGG